MWLDRPALIQGGLRHLGDFLGFALIDALIDQGVIWHGDFVLLNGPLVWN
jgi:hypothetical protein